MNCYKICNQKKSKKIDNYINFLGSNDGNNTKQFFKVNSSGGILEHTRTCMLTSTGILEHLLSTT
jgi:hypothetical protein